MAGEVFNPTKYGMEFCDICNGDGYVHYYPERQTCPKCGGFGLLLKQRNGIPAKTGSDQHAGMNNEASGSGNSIRSK